MSGFADYDARMEMREITARLDEEPVPDPVTGQQDGREAVADLAEWMHEKWWPSVGPKTAPCSICVQRAEEVLARVLPQQGELPQVICIECREEGVRRVVPYRNGAYVCSVHRDLCHVEMDGQQGEPEGTLICDQCGRPDATGLGAGTYWFADNELWNSIFPDRVGVSCPRCFTAACRGAGVVIGWRAGRVGDVDALVAPQQGEPDEGMECALCEIAGFAHSGIESLGDARDVAIAALAARENRKEPVDE